MKRWIMIMIVGLVSSQLPVIGGCKVADLDHCLHRGEHVWCEANEPERRFCSPCEPVGDHFGCVAEAPAADACPAFEPPAGTDATSSSGSTTSAVDADGSSTSGADAPEVRPDSDQRADGRHTAARP